ncbi:MAG: class I SAM-dependent methyltransferase [Crocinitomicaceae bacterium]|nr:class I SAM-dependent methyltransferase [Crocinitomicaceae bacterium]
MGSEKVKAYYNSIAADYDHSRFENSYGTFIDKAERKLLKRWLKSNKNVLDLGCGTGRFLDLASQGSDFSDEMLRIAGKKYPEKLLHHAAGSSIPAENDSLDAVFSMHVFMHLSQSDIQDIVNEVYRVLKPGGTFIFDFPSSKRRNLVKYKANGWHAATSFDKPAVLKLLASKFEIEKSRGILVVPIHRLPNFIRFIFQPADWLLSHVGFKWYSSYIILKCRKK